MNIVLKKRPDGKYEEKLGGFWFAEYSEHPVTGLWQVEVFKRDVPELFAIDYASLEDARQAAQNYYNQI